jgi:hypothetical protein
MDKRTSGSSRILREQKESAHMKKTHGDTVQGKRSRTWVAWMQMRQRCRNPRAHNYYLYGARGISICVRWDSFDVFKRDMGNAPRGRSLGRIKNDRDYSPGNCEWQTARQQANNRRGNRRLTMNGVTRTVHEWARALRVPVSRIKSRLFRNLPVEKVLSKRRFK